VSAGTLLITLAQFTVSLMVGWVAGDLLLARARGHASAETREGIGLPERALAAVVGLCAFCVAAMVVNIVTSGVVFGSPIPLPIAAAALVLLGIKRRAWPRGVPWAAVLSLTAVLAVIFILPDVLGGSGVRTGDPPWHLGWTEQLLDGEPLPTGPAPEFARNGYPWGWHGVLATLVRLMPGSDAVIAHETMHIWLVLAIPLGAACLARRLDRRAGWAAAGAASLVGGWGWIAAGEPDFVTTPLFARYGADLVVASPNSVYELFTPAFPRELGLVLLAAGAVLVAVAAQTGGRDSALSAGFVIGLAGLMSVPMLMSGIVWMLAGGLVAPRGSRLRVLAAMSVATALTFGLWFGPLMVDFFRYGGFVDVTPRLGVEWPVGSSLWSWGLLLPAAVAGVIIVARSRWPNARVALSIGIGSLCFLALCVARGRFGWELAGNATLLHQGRAWPPFHLLAAAFAGVAVAAGYRRLAQKSRALAVAAVGAAVTVAAISPVFASKHLTEVIEDSDEGYQFARYDMVPGSFVRRAAGRLDSGDVVLVKDSDFLGLMLFSFSGARLAEYDNAQLDNNDLRIRFSDLAQRWDEQMAAGGFDPDYTVVPAEDVPPGAEPLETGEFGEEPRAWALIDHRRP
jgi:hypothetical protein